MVALRQVDVIAGGKQIQCVCGRIVSVRCDDPRRGRGAHAAANSDLARKPSCNECQVGWYRHSRWRGDGCIRARKSAREAIQKRGGENVGLLKCNDLVTRAADLDEI